MDECRNFISERILYIERHTSQDDVSGLLNLHGYKLRTEFYLSLLVRTMLNTQLPSLR